MPNLDQVPPTFSTWMTDIPFLQISHLCLWNFSAGLGITTRRATGGAGSALVITKKMKWIECKIRINETKTTF